MDKSVLINGFEQALKSLNDALASPARSDLGKWGLNPFFPKGKMVSVPNFPYHKQE
ncbi:MAG: hypothetical protein ACYC5X_07000 [Syntrophales bacterium]